MRRNSNNSGVSVVSVVVGLGVVGAMVALAAALFSQNIAILKKQEDASTAEDLRRYLAVAMVCPPAGPAWVPDSEIAVSNLDGSDLIRIGSAGYLKIGGQCLRAVVTATTPIKTFDVHYSPNCTEWKSLSFPKQCP